MNNRQFFRLAMRSDTALLLGLALLKVIIHLLTNQHYGYFGDEFYYAICGERLDWGYVDHAPLIAVITALTRMLFGDSLAGLRFFPALAGAGLVLLTGLMARELGGKRFTQALAALMIVFVTTFLFTHTFLSMNAFEPLIWLLAAACLIRVVKTGDQRLWLLFGLIAGMGLMNKHSMVFFGVGWLSVCC